MIGCNAGYTRPADFPKQLNKPTDTPQLDETNRARTSIGGRGIRDLERLRLIVLVPRAPSHEVDGAHLLFIFLVDWT